MLPKILAQIAFISASAAAQSAGNATEAFIFGYPLVNAKRSRDALFCQRNLTSNQLFNSRHLSDYNITNTTTPGITPNIDTLYDQAFLDLRQGPILLSYQALPQYSRFHTFQILDIFTNTLANFGTTQYGYGNNSFLVLPPGSANATGLPDVTASVVSPTYDVWLLGRTGKSASANAALAYNYSTTYQLSVLTNFSNTTSVLPRLPAPDCQNLLSSHVLNTSASAFFDEVSAVLAANPPSANYSDAVSNLAALGLSSNASFANLSSTQQQALQDGVTQGQPIVNNASVSEQTRVSPDWIASLNAGYYAQDYLAAAAYAVNLPAANVANETVYFTYSRSSNSTSPPLSGENAVTLTFTNETLPPVAQGGFWSLISYDASTLFFYPNSEDRFGVTSHSPKTTYLGNGSVISYLSHTAPPASLNSSVNWVPVPSGDFFVILRLYGATNLTYVPPSFVTAS